MSGKPVDMLAHSSTGSLGKGLLTYFNTSRNQMIAEGLF